MQSATPVRFGVAADIHALVSGLVAGRDFFRPQCIRKPPRGRAGLERLLLTLMRRPAREPRDLEGRAQAAVRIGKAFFVKLRHTHQCRALERHSPALDQRVRCAHSAQIAHDGECAVVADDQLVRVGDGQRKAGALQQGTKIPQIREGRDARRQPAFHFTFSERKRLAQFGQRFAAEERGKHQPIRPQRAADLNECTGKVVDRLQCERRDGEIERGIGERKCFFVGDDVKPVSAWRIRDGNHRLNFAAARERTLAREQEWIAASPRARQAKSKARYQRYEELLQKAGEKQAQTAQIVIPVAERLGQNVIDFDHLRKGFADNLLIDELSFKLPAGGIVGVIGPNGAGKTTLFRMITKQETPDQGTIQIGESVRLGYVDQSRDSLDGNHNVWEEISGGNDIVLLGKREMNSRAYCANFNFKGADQQKKVGQLSGGERNRVHLAKMLKSGANVLLLDEPTNDLDVDTLRALEEALEDFAGCAVIISHDRWFLDRIATHILAFEGESHVEWFEGNYQDYEKDKMRRLGIESIIPQRIKYKKFSR